MKYQNPKIPEGINVSNEHPLKEFATLVLGLGTFTVILVASLSMAAGWLVHYIPFEIEKELSQSVFLSDKIPSGNAPSGDEEPAPINQAPDRIRDYLQTLADQLSAAQQLPEGMTITVHYIDDDTVNAFATLGGNIIMFRGLIEKLPHENALAMVMAHEIAHIKHRDPMVALGRGITVGIALSSLAGFGHPVAEQLLGQIGLVTSLSFNRSQEAAADEEALLTLQRYYGHTNGAEVLFEVLDEARNQFTPPAFLSTHPVTAQRIEAIKSQQTALGENEYRRLPSFLR